MKKITEFFKSFSKNEFGQPNDTAGFTKCINEDLELPEASFSFDEKPVRVQIAFTKTKVGEETGQLMTKESLTKMMRDDNEFDSFLQNQYKLQSTIIVKGVKNIDDKEQNIYVSGSIPVNLARSSKGKKKNKEITIRGKLYKSENMTLGTVEDKPTLSMRKVDVPLKELRSSLTGFTRRVSTFKVVPWLSAVFIPQKPYSPKETLKHEINERESGKTRKFTLNTTDRLTAIDTGSYRNKNLIALPTNLEYNNFTLTDFNETETKVPSTPVSFLSLKSVDGEFNKTIKDEQIQVMIDTNENNSDIKKNVKDNSVLINNEMKTYFENTKHEKKLSQTESQIQSCSKQSGMHDRSFHEKKHYFENKAQKKPEISEQSLFNKTSCLIENSCTTRKMKESINSLDIEKTNCQPSKSSKEKINIIGKGINNSMVESIENNFNTNGKHLTVIPRQYEFQNSDKDEIQISSITITRSRTRIIKYDDGSGVEEKIGRQTIRVSTPSGALYKSNNHASASSNVPLNKSNSKIKKDKNIINITTSENVDNDNITGENYKVGNLYSTHNVFHMKYPKDMNVKSEQSKLCNNINYNELLWDKYNPLTWLYSNYNKTKSLIMKFNEHK